MIEIDEHSMYRSVVDEEFRALLAAEPDLFGLAGLAFPEAVEHDVQQELAGTVMADAGVQAGDTTCAWGMTVRCDRLTNL